jgi:hypothetical protein
VKGISHDLIVIYWEMSKLKSEILDRHR